MLFCSAEKCYIVFYAYRLSHFDYVKTEDLERVGMSKPAIRRLQEAVKKRKNRGKKGLLDKVCINVAITYYYSCDFHQRLFLFPLRKSLWTRGGRIEKQIAEI